MKEETSIAAPENYTVPQLSKANPKEWFIFFTYTYQGEEHRLKKREGLYLNEALDFALSKKTLLKKSKLDYTSMLDLVKNGYGPDGYGNLIASAEQVFPLLHWHLHNGSHDHFGQPVLRIAQ